MLPASYLSSAGEKMFILNLSLTRTQRVGQSMVPIRVLGGPGKPFSLDPQSMRLAKRYLDQGDLDEARC